MIKHSIVKANNAYKKNEEDIKSGEMQRMGPDRPSLRLKLPVLR